MALLEWLRVLHGLDGTWLGTIGVIWWCIRRPLEDVNQERLG